MIRRKTQGTLIERIRNWSVVSWLLIINISLFILLNVAMIFYESVFESVLLPYFALKPASVFAGDYFSSLLLHMFSHLSLAHLFLNMFALFSLGGLCERIIGRKRFFWFYLFGGLFAGLLSVVLAGFFGYGFFERIFGSPDAFMLGASGAIFAIAGLFVVLLPKLRFSIIFFPFVSFPAYIMIPVILGLVWVLTIAFNLPIGNVAHFGGFLAGLAYGFYLKKKYRRKVMMLQRFFR